MAPSQLLSLLVIAPTGLAILIALNTKMSFVSAWLVLEGLFVGLYYLVISSRFLSTSKRSEILKAAGVERYQHLTSEDGIGLNERDKTITLINRKNFKTYPFDDVRKWETISAKSGKMVGVGSMTALIGAAEANSLAKHQARKSSGLFVTVRDIDDPVWHINIIDEREQARWMEILNQFINEGRAS